MCAELAGRCFELWHTVPACRIEGQPLISVIPGERTLRCWSGRPSSPCLTTVWRKASLEDDRCC